MIQWYEFVSWHYKLWKPFNTEIKDLKNEDLNLFKGKKLLKLLFCFYSTAYTPLFVKTTKKKYITKCDFSGWFWRSKENPHPDPGHRAGQDQTERKLKKLSIYAVLSSPQGKGCNSARKKINKVSLLFYLSISAPGNPEWTIFQRHKEAILFLSKKEKSHGSDKEG